MKNILATLLPAKADNTIRGMKLPVYVFALISIISTVRSCIHLLAPDGGAGSIAGMDLSVAGARGIICLCVVGQCTTDLRPDPTGSGLSIQVINSVHVRAANPRNPVASIGRAHEAG